MIKMIKDNKSQKVATQIKILVKIIYCIGTSLMLIATVLMYKIDLYIILLSNLTIHMNFTFPTMLICH